MLRAVVALGLLAVLYGVGDAQVFYPSAQRSSHQARDRRIASIKWIYYGGVITGETRLRFSPASPTLISYDAYGLDGCRDVWIGDTNGNALVAVSHERVGLPQKSNGNSRFNPAGTVVVFTSEIDDHAGDDTCPTDSDPGIGTCTNYWAYFVADGTISQLTDTPTVSCGNGVEFSAMTNPQWSSDGTKLYYAEMFNGSGFSGTWRIRECTIAIVGSTVSCSADVVVFTPITGRAATPMGWIDANRLLVSCWLDGQHTYRQDICILDHSADTWVNLTKTVSSPHQAWDEDASLYPGGNWFVYMSTRDWDGAAIDESTPVLGGLSARTRELYLMKLDGSKNHRLTWYNDPTAPEYRGPQIGNRVITNDMDWSPDGTQLLSSAWHDTGTGASIESTTFAPALITLSAPITD